LKFSGILFKTNYRLLLLNTFINIFKIKKQLLKNILFVFFNLKKIKKKNKYYLKFNDNLNHLTFLKRYVLLKKKIYFLNLKKFEYLQLSIFFIFILIENFFNNFNYVVNLNKM